MLHADNARNRLIGIAIVCLATLCFSLLDGTAKWLIKALPVVQIVWLRFALQTAISMTVMAPIHGRRMWRTKAPALQALRALLLGTMTGCNFLALRYLQLAETTSIMFISPLLVALAGWLWLNEKLDGGRWLAIATGFVGVLVILRPGASSFHWAMLLSLAVAIMITGFSLLSRRLAAIDNPATTQLLSGMGAVVLLAPAAWWVWQPLPDITHWLALIGASTAAAVGHYMLALSFRYAPASTLAPFQYLQILYMIALGYWMFGDVPSQQMVVGAGIVIASGIYLLARETRVKAQAGREGAPVND
ncbi:MAG: DMT family transporter [Burkholderiaceae bacterium]